MANPYKILLVDDDNDLCDVLRERLEAHQDFDISVQDTAAACIAATTNGSQWDLLILDVGLPDMDGREACKLVRKNGFNAPIVMLTGETADADVVLGLDAGANDYVTKPFKFPVLLARIRAQLRQHVNNEDAILSLGPYRFQPSAKVLIEQNGGKIRLTAKETSILKFLYRSAANLTSRDVLLREVWGYNANVTTHTLETHIYRLRQKIEPDPAKANLLKTEPGGYRLAL